MRLLSLKLEKHPILWNLELDFTDSEWNPVDTIIIWWENGTWKSTILNIIYNLWNKYYKISKSEKIIFEIFLSNDEVRIFDNFWYYFNEWELKNIIFTMFYEDWLKINIKTRSLWNQFFNNYPTFLKDEIYKIFNSIYSDVWIDYNSIQKNSVTSKTLDNDINNPIKSSPNLANEITQLLIDIDVQDAQDFQNYYKVNWEKGLKEQESKRMKRFENAFNFMFENKKFKEIKTISDWKEIIFEENGKECNINQLSSWEKQIVFRWSFLLQNKNSINWNPILIDEPEISLHPNWQLRILNFYKNIFIDKSWIQSSQIFIVTHSPFILHNPNRLNDKVITLSKDNWKIIVDEKPKFFWFSTAEEFVSESFNLSLLTPIIYQIAYLKIKWVDFTKDNLESKFNENSSFAIHAAKWAGAVAWLLRMKNDTIFEGKTIIWLFDFDKEWREQFYYLSKEGFWKEQVDWGKEWEKVYWEKELWYYKKRNDNWDFYAMLLPIPERLSKYADITWKDFASYIEIEDLLSEAFLQSQGCLEKKSTPAWDKQFVKDDKKRHLWKALIDEPKETFLDFKPIFDRVEWLIEIKNH